MSETATPEPVEPQEPTEPTPEPEPDTEPEPEPTEPTEPQDEPQEPAPEQETQARMEEIGKKLDLLQKHVAKRLGDILGEDATLYVPCELCTPWQTPGFRPPVEQPPEVVAALYHLLGQRAPSDLQKDPHSEPCDECAGEGSVATLSKVDGQAALPCVKCKNLGWLPTDDTRRGGAVPVVNGTSPLYPPPSPDAFAAPEPAEPDPPEVEMLKQKGYTVFRPFVPTG